MLVCGILVSDVSSQLKLTLTTAPGFFIRTLVLVTMSKLNFMCQISGVPL